MHDLRGESLRVWDGGRGVDAGRAFGSFQADALQGHRHSALVGSGFCERSPTGDWNGNSGGTNAIYGGVTTGNPTADTNNGTPRTAKETRSRNTALPAYIKF